PGRRDPAMERRRGATLRALAASYRTQDARQGHPLRGARDLAGIRSAGVGRTGRAWPTADSPENRPRGADSDDGRSTVAGLASGHRGLLAGARGGARREPRTERRRVHAQAPLLAVQRRTPARRLVEVEDRAEYDRR